MDITTALCFQDGKVYIFVQTNQDLFEPSLFKPVYDPVQYKTILSDIKEVLSIIDILKLDQNIGL